MEPNMNLFFYDRDTAIYTYLIMVEKELSVSTFIVSELNYIQVNALKEASFKAELCTLKMQQIILHVLLFTAYLAWGVVWQALSSSDNVCFYIFSNCTLFILWLVHL